MKKKKNVLVFVLIAFGFSWLFWVPEALIAQGWAAPDFVQNFVALNLGAWGPLIGALVTTFIYEGGAGLKKMLKSGINVRLGKWWLVGLLIFPVLIGGALGLAILFGSPTPEFPVIAEAAESGAPLPVFPFARSVEKQRAVRQNPQTVLMGGIGPVPNHFLPGNQGKIRFNRVTFRNLSRM